MRLSAFAPLLELGPIPESCYGAKRLDIFPVGGVLKESGSVGFVKRGQGAVNEILILAIQLESLAPALQAETEAFLLGQKVRLAPVNIAQGSPDIILPLVVLAHRFVQPGQGPIVPLE